MKKQYILFIDSGIGGLSTLSETMKILKANYIYYADNLNCPYGSHTPNQIQNYLKNIISQLKQTYKIKIVVLACNTATTSSIDYLKKEFADIIFIGTQPAINLAVKYYKKPLCIATPLTIKQKKYLSLVKKSNIEIKSIGLEHFAKDIEDYMITKTLEYKIKLIKDIFYLKSISKSFDCIILGCTHYALISDILAKHIKLPLINSNTEIGENVKSFASKIKLTTNKSSIKIILSSNNDLQKQKYIKILNQILAK